MPTQDIEAKYSVSNLTRGLDVIELLAEHPAGMGVSEIAQRLEIPKNAAFRITAALCERAYLLRNEESKSFSLSPRLMTMGYKAANCEGLIERAMPLMRELRDAVKETVVLCKLLDTGGIVIEQVPGVYPFRFVVDAGNTFRLHSSAQGKAMLAYMPAELQSRIIDRLKLTRFNERTIATKHALREELEKVRQLGYALDRAEEFEGVHCCAAPLLDARNYPVAAISLTGPAHRFTEEMFDSVGRQVSECAQRISQTLGMISHQ